MPLTTPLPRQIRIVRARGTGPERALTLTMTVPEPVVELLSQTLELAGRLTASDQLGALLAAMSLECLGEWSARADEQARSRGVQMLGGLEAFSALLR